MEKRRLYRAPRKDSIIGGVCAGMANYLDADPTIVRLLWAIGSLLWGLGILAYLVAWLIIPRK